MKEILLTRSKVALVDDEDFEKLSRFKWQAKKSLRTFYAVRTQWTSKTTRIYLVMHRVILGLEHADKRQCDHKNGNGLDNRRSNIRIATKRENSYNHTLVRSSNGFKGVYFAKHKATAQKPYRAFIKKGKQIYLGCFETAKLAALAYDTAAIELFGEFACTNASLGLL
jgi:AP2 domain.